MASTDQKSASFYIADFLDALHRRARTRGSLVVQVLPLGLDEADAQMLR